MDPSLPWRRAQAADALSIGGDSPPPRAIPAAADPVVPAQEPPAKPLRAILIALAASALLWALAARLL
jgi:hypothetical protein